MDLIGGREIKMNYYAKKGGEPFPILLGQVMEMNEQGCDIFWTPQEFPEGKRKKEDLINVRFIYADFDDITKEDMATKLRRMPVPTMVIRTRSGYHVYYMLEEYIPYSPTLADYYREFVGEALIPLGADPNAKDVSRLMRAPMSRYWWDSKNNSYADFQIYTQIVMETTKRYDLKELEKMFTRVKKEEEFFVKSTKNSFDKNESFWQKANSLDPVSALQVLSGSTYVNGERFSFKKSARLIRIYVDDKPTNAWIDEKNTIGSTKEAGPSIVNWLMFYGHSKAKVAEILKEKFPEIV